MHSLVVVFIPADSQDIDAAVAHALAPFNCELEVEEYEVECGCVGSQAHLEAHRYAEQIAGTEQERDDRFQQEHRASNVRRVALYELSEKRTLTPTEQAEIRSLVEEFDRNWTNAHELYNRTFYDAWHAHPLFNVPDPDCEICGGSGKNQSDINPLAQWDYWSIGWRDGYFKAPIEEVEKPAKESNFFQRLLKRWKKLAEDMEDIEGAGDITAVRDIPADWPLPFAAVSDGQWYENQCSPCLPQRENEEMYAEWEKTYQQLLMTHQDGLAVACRVHS